MKSRIPLSLACLLCAATASAGLDGNPVRQPQDSITVTVPLHYGWNLLSNPVRTASDTIQDLFPNGMFAWAFRYDPRMGWVQTNRAPNGIGVWYRAFPGEAHVRGGAILSESIAVAPQWNIIGSISHPVPTDQISSIPPGIVASPFFWHDGQTFIIADTIVPGFGYYVKVSDFGHIVLTLPASPAKP